MMKKFVATALVLLLALSLFGCGRMDTYDDYRYNREGATRYSETTPNITDGATDGSYNPAINGQTTTGMRARGYNVTDPALVLPGQ